MTLALLLWLMADPYMQAAAGSAQFPQVSGKAAAAREGNRIEEAIQLYRESVRLRPAWAEGWWYLGTLFYDRDDYASARDALARFVKLDPAGGPGWALLGLCEYRIKNYEDSLEHLRHALTLGLSGNPPVERVSRLHTALLLTHFGQFEAALQIFMRLAGAGSSEDPETIAAVGIAALRMPLLPPELPAAKREIVFQVGRAVFDTGARRAAEARREFDELLAKYGDAPQIHYLYGSFLLMSDSDAALRELKRELEISPRHVQARLQLAFEYLKRGEPTSALPYAREAASLEPDSFVGHNALGRVLIEAGDLERGIAELETARNLAPESPENRVALAAAYAKAGRKQEAAREREEFLRLKKQQEKPDEP